MPGRSMLYLLLVSSLENADAQITSESDAQLDDVSRVELMEYLKSHGIRDHPYSLSGCFVLPGNLRTSGMGHVLISSGSSGEIIGFANNTFYPLSIVRYFKKGSVLETHGGMWSKAYVGDVFRGLKSHHDPVQELVTIESLLKIGFSTQCETEFPVLNRYLHAQDVEASEKN